MRVRTMLARWRRRSRLRPRRPAIPRSEYENPYRYGTCAKDWTDDHRC